MWREVEEEEEGLKEGSPRLVHAAVWRRQLHQSSEEDKDLAWRRRRISACPDHDCGHVFVLGTLAAVFALVLNLLYPFLSKLEVRGG